MKSFLEYLKANPIYLESFSSREDVFNSFEENDDPDVIICFACYDTPMYEGYAMVIIYRESTKKFYEVYASHCSCYGLEDQWKEEEIVPEELENRLQNGDIWDGGFLKRTFDNFRKEVG